MVSDYTSAVEIYSIDEVFADLTKACNVRRQADQLISLSANQFVNPFEEAVSIATEIKRRFKTEVGDWLRCSIGIAENKLLAKIGSDIKKPDGLTVIRDVAQTRGLPYWEKQAGGLHYSSDCVILSKRQLYNQLCLTDIPGIGRRQEKNLNQLGIRTLKDLRDFPKSHLVSRFGNIMGHHLYNIGQLEGTWKELVHQEQDIKSMGHMYTLPKEFRKPEFFLPVLYKLCDMVGRRLRKKQLMGNVIHFYCHDKDYEGWGKSVKLGYFLQDGREIFLVAADMHAGLSDQVKLIGITVAGLRPCVNQLSLFGDAERQKRLIEALDKINDKYGEFTILRAQMLPAGKAFADSIGFGRVKELG